MKRYIRTSTEDYTKGTGAEPRKQKKEIPSDGVKRYFIDSYNEYEYYKPTPKKVGDKIECEVMLLPNLMSPHMEYAALRKEVWVQIDGQSKVFKTNKFTKKVNNVVQPFVLGDLFRYQYAFEWIPKEQREANPEKPLKSTPKIGVDGEPMLNKHSGNSLGMAGMYCDVYGVASMVYNHIGKDQNGDDDYVKINSPKRFIWVYILSDDTVNDKGEKVFEGRIMPMLINGNVAETINQWLNKGVDLFNFLGTKTLKFTYEIKPGKSAFNSSCSVELGTVEMLEYKGENGFVPILEGFGEERIAQIKDYFEALYDIESKNAEISVKNEKFADNPKKQKPLLELPQEPEFLTEAYEFADEKLKAIQGYDICEVFGNPSEIHPNEAVKLSNMLLRYIAMAIDDKNNKYATLKNLLKIYLEKDHAKIKRAIEIIRGEKDEKGNYLYNVSAADALSQAESELGNEVDEHVEMNEDELISDETEVVGADNAFSGDDEPDDLPF